MWAEAALKRGAKVVATARALKGVADLALDVTDPDQVRSAVAQANAHFGRLDIVINNADYALVGAVEEASEAEIRAVLPVLRQ